MRISDWSSDVCSSDLKFGHIGDAETRPIGAAQADILVDPPVDTQLVIPVAAEQVIIRKAHRAVDRQRFEERRVGEHGNRKLKIGFLGRGRAREDRKSVVYGKSVTVSVELGCRRIIKKKKK